METINTNMLNRLYTYLSLYYSSKHDTNKVAPCQPMFFAYIAHYLACIQQIPFTSLFLSAPFYKHIHWQKCQACRCHFALTKHSQCTFLVVL